MKKYNFTVRGFYQWEKIRL